MKLDPGEAGRGEDRRERLPWQRAALVVGLLSLACWIIILLVTRWLLG